MSEPTILLEEDKIEGGRRSGPDIRVVASGPPANKIDVEFYRGHDAMGSPIWTSPHAEELDRVRDVLELVILQLLLRVKDSKVTDTP